MCELLGLSANVPTDICFSFTGLLQRGGKTGPHKDGWGIAFYEGRGVRLFIEPHPSSDSEFAKLFQHYPIKSKNVISHIRKANRGRVCLENTHPFTRELWGRHWTYAHNGQLRGIKKWPLKHYIPVGTTDSEHAFCWIMDQIRSHYRKLPSRPETLWKFIAQRAHEISEMGVFNMLLSNGQYMFAYSSKKLHYLTRKAPFGAASLIDTEVTINFEHETTPKDVMTVICSSPLTHDELWLPVPKHTLLVFQDGVLLASLEKS